MSQRAAKHSPPASRIDRLGLVCGRDVGDRDAVPVAGQSPRARRADRLGAAGDDRDAAVALSGASGPPRLVLAPVSSRRPVRTHWQILVGGELRDARSGETIEATNPASGEVIGTFPRCDAQDVDDAVRAAARRVRELACRRTRWSARAACSALADLIAEHAEELAMLDVTENGSPIREMRNDANIAIAALRYFAGLALQLRGETIPGDARPAELHADGAVRRRRPDRPVQPPDDVRGGKIGRAADRRQHGRDQALRAHLDLGAARSRELAAQVFPPGVVNVVTGLRRRGRRRARHPPRRAPARVHRLGGDRPRGSRRGRPRTSSRR